jgi:hypothetical protein
MKSTERMALLYGVAFVGAAGVSMYRGRQGQEVLVDTVLHGFVAGTAFNIVDWTLVQGSPVEESALGNPFGAFSAIVNRTMDMGRMGKKAVDLLTDVDSSLYDDFKKNGVKIGPIDAQQLESTRP